MRTTIASLVELAHPQVLEFAGCCSVSGLTVLFDLPFHGTLRTVLDRGDVLVNAMQKERVLIDVSLAMEFLDAYETAATMVTSSSVFVTATLGARVCATGMLLNGGFGDCTQTGGQLSDVLLRWGAPELLAQGAASLPTAASGVWSFGVLMWELFQEEPGITVPY